MERLVFECAVRATFIAASTAFILWVMRIKSASARHRAWTGVMLLMLVLPVWTAFGPDIPLRVLPPARYAAETPSTQVPMAALPASGGIQGSEEITPGILAKTPSAPMRGSVMEWQSLMLGIYFLGLSVMLLRLLMGTVQARRLIRSAVLQDGRLTSSACTSPITVGWFNPVVILPIEWQQWPEDQLNAILTHESEHASRYHPFAQWMALLNRAVFWFHPLAWWLERKIAALSEEACDAAVLAAGHSPQDYSHYLLNLARSMMRDGKRVQIVGMAMPGSCLKTRIRQILVGIPAQRLSRMRIGCTIAFCAVSSVVVGGASLSPREVTPAISKVAALPVPSGISPGLKPAVAEQQTLPSSSPGPLVAEVPGGGQSEIVPATPPGAPQMIAEEGSTLSTPLQQDTTVPTTPPASNPSLLPGLVGLTFRSAQMPGVWWTNPLLLSRLELTEDQKAKIEKAFENHRQSIMSSRERLRNEETQHARLLEADPVDEQAVLAQIDRVVQARGQMERASAAMNLEVRGYLTPAQWTQLRAQVPITSIDYVARLQIVPTGGPATNP